MQVKWASFLLMCFMLAPVAANDGRNDEQPDSELLEYLGEWAGTDKDWADPVDIRDMKFSDDKKIVTEHK